MNMIRANKAERSKKKQIRSHIGLDDFIDGRKKRKNGKTYVSLFSGGGIGDDGLQRAGYTCVASAELDELRAAVLEANTREGKVFRDIREEGEDLISYVKAQSLDLDLLVATPPCQSFSTANAKRGKNDSPHTALKDQRSSLFFYALDIVNALKPKVVVIENVPNFFTRKIKSLDGKLSGTVGEFSDAILKDYVGYRETICMSDYGVPQRRKRALGIYCRKDIVDDAHQWLRGEHTVLPSNWKTPFRGNGCRCMTAEEALAHFPPLDGKDESVSSSKVDPLHVVPTYNQIHYRWIAEIPGGSGLGAYENDVCPSCGVHEVPKGEAFCPSCGAKMVNRPHVENQQDGFRLVKGFKTSYRRMRPDIPSSTVTTSSSHFGSDLKLHPYQNRVLSIRECCFLQTVPNDFDWSPALDRSKSYSIRQMVGEAIPAWFAFQLGMSLKQILK